MPHSRVPENTTANEPQILGYPMKRHFARFPARSRYSKDLVPPFHNRIRKVYPLPFAFAGLTRKTEQMDDISLTDIELSGDCQICLRRLERFEPVFRMQFGPEINNGWRTSVCSRCLSAFVESLKRPGLRDRFRSPKACEVCARPVYNLKRWTVAQAICSPRCRGIIDTERTKQRGSSRSFGFLA